MIVILWKNTLTYHVIKPVVSANTSFVLMNLTTATFVIMAVILT